MMNLQNVDDDSAFRCLVVDDDLDLLEEIEFSLKQRMGAVVLCAANGQNAVAVALESRPQLVLMDINMPSWNGLRAAEVIRRLLPEAIIVLLSGDAIALAEAAQQPHLATYTLCKPIDMAAFQKLVCSIRETC